MTPSTITSRPNRSLLITYRRCTNGDNAAHGSPLPARSVARGRLRLRLRVLRSVREVADGGRVEPHRRGHSAARRRRAPDGRLRDDRETRLVPRGPTAREDRSRVWIDPDRWRAAVLLQRRGAPVR